MSTEKRSFFQTRNRITDSIDNPQVIGSKNRFLKTKFGFDSINEHVELNSELVKPNTNKSAHENRLCANQHKGTKL
jgi:hypothetical protein